MAPADVTPQKFSRIVVGVHQGAAWDTFSVASMFAAHGDAEVELVFAGSKGAKQVQADALDLAVAAGIPEQRLHTSAHKERPAAALHIAAATGDADLIVVGRGGDQLAKVPRQVAHNAPCDVLVAARRVERPKRYRRVLVATDGSATADRAARHGYAVAGAFDAEVVLLFAGHPATGELVIDGTLAMVGGDTPTRAIHAEGDPAHVIVDTAMVEDADLVVVGNKGMTGPRILDLHSVPGAVLKGCAGDVLLARTVRQRSDEIRPGEGGVTEQDGAPIATYVDEEGVVHLMSAICTHLGCVVVWNPADGTFDCPCHGSRFGPLGDVAEGPAKHPLEQLPG
jgi:nucleotide-binding universal stress UspA family protein/nitrite reductase/ring-hydroxylating ferredoxin subunit